MQISNTGFLGSSGYIVFWKIWTTELTVFFGGSGGGGGVGGEHINLHIYIYTYVHIYIFTHV